MPRSRRSEATSAPRQMAGGPVGFTPGGSAAGSGWTEAAGAWEGGGGAGPRLCRGPSVQRRERGTGANWGRGPSGPRRAPASRGRVQVPGACPGPGGCGNPPPSPGFLGYPPDRGSRHRQGSQRCGLDGRGRRGEQGRPRPPSVDGAAPVDAPPGLMRRPVDAPPPVDARARSTHRLRLTHRLDQRRNSGQRRGRPSPVRTWIRRTRPGPHSAPRRSRSLPLR